MKNKPNFDSSAHFEAFPASQTSTSTEDKSMHSPEKIMSVYFDNAASGPLHPLAWEAMIPYLRDEYGNPSSVHSHGRKLRAAIEQSRKTMAEILNCAPSEIIFTSGGTEADNQILLSAFYSGKVTHFISSHLEHHAVTHTLEKLVNKNATVDYLKPDKKGNLDLDELENLLKKNSDKGIMVSLMHANNEIGTLINLNKVGSLCKKFGAFFHSDTVQSMGHIPLKLSETPVDFVTGAAHKFYGPKGVGFLYCSPEAQISSLICGGGQERNQRAGTENVAGIVGMAKAFQWVHENHSILNSKLWTLKNLMKNLLIENFPGVDFNGETEEWKSLPTVLNVAFPAEDEDSLLLFNLDIYQISASGGSACSSGSVHPSHVLAEIGCDRKRMLNSVRFSFGYRNTEEEVHYVIDKLKKIIKTS